MKHHNHFQTYKPTPETRPEPSTAVIWAGACAMLACVYLLTIIAFSI